MPNPLHIERLFNGRPLIAPTGRDWESGVTFNSSAVYLNLNDQNRETIRQLLGPDQELRDIVVLHYRARPKVDPDFRHTRSYIGLSIHEPDLTLIQRFESPVVVPGSPNEADFLGSEDPRVTFLDGTWWMVYCGVQPHADPDPDKAWLGTVCLARSEDLVHWTKLGPLTSLNGATGEDFSNKDGVLFPERIDGKVMLLHRPMDGDMNGWKTAIASSNQPEGPFTNLGPVHGANHKPEYMKSWTGAGAVPIRLSEGRYLSIEHTGNLFDWKHRKYVLDAFIYDFNHWDPAKPETLVQARLDDFMRPETPCEIHGPFPESVANVVFACGAYVHEGWLYIVYGGGDSYILAARVRLDELVQATEAHAHSRQTTAASV